MTVKLEFNPFIDALIYSGLDVKEKVLTAQPLPIVQATALANLEKTYEEHKNKVLSSLKYGEFLTGVEGNITKFDDLDNPTEKINNVAAKLQDSAKNYIETQEKEYSWLDKFFERTSQLAIGHGYRTQGEWGIELASRMIKRELKAFNNRIQQCIFHDRPLKSTENGPQGIFDNMKADINSLTEDQFREVLNKVLFQKIHEKKLIIDNKNKLSFYTNLCPEKRNFFDETLLSRSDWYEQIVDMTGYPSKPEAKATKIFKELLLKKTTALYQPNSPLKLDAEVVSMFQRHAKRNLNLYLPVVDAALKTYLDKNDFRKITYLLDKLIEYLDFAPGNILSSSTILTDDEISNVNKNTALLGTGQE